MKVKVLLVLLALILGASLLGACSSQQNHTATADEAVNRVYPEGEGKFYDPSAVISTAAESTAAEAATHAATKATSARPKTTKATTATDSTGSQPTTVQGNVPPDNITDANINPNLGTIQSQVAARMEALSVKSISLSETSLTLEAGESRQLRISFNPSDAAIKSCSMTVSNSNAAATLSGTTVTVKGIKAGTATLTVTSHNGHSAACNITVKRSETPVTDDTVLSHADLCTAENANRWSEAVAARLATLGMNRNGSLSGASAELSTAMLNNMSYRDAESELTSQAESLLSSLTGGNWTGFDYNCFAEESGGNFVITIVINESAE